MSKPQQKEAVEVQKQAVEVRLSFANFPRRMYVNRFRIERDDDCCIAHFGLLAPSGVLVDHYCCVITKFTLEQNKASLIAYLQRIGQPGSKPERWQPPAHAQQTDIADIVSMSHRDEITETAFSGFSMIAATRAKPSQGSTDVHIDAQPLILLRSEAELQKQLLVALYEEE
jgi:hypothetical protein